MERTWGSFADGTVRRAVLLAGIVAGVLLPAYFFLFAAVTPLAWDFHAYLAGAEAYLAGDPFVGVRPEVGRGQFVYPPIVVLLFAPYALLDGWLPAFLVQLGLNLTLGLALAWLIVGVVEDRLGRALPTVDRALVAGFCLVGTYPMIALGQGQIDHAVAIALVLGFCWIERGGEAKAGVAFGVAAVLKLFPALVGIWLLHRRAWRAIAAAVGTGLGALGASVLLFGVDTHLRYAAFLLAERSRVGEFGGTMDPNFMALTLNRPLSAVLPGVDPRLYTPVAALLFLPVLWALYSRSRTFEDRLVAFLGTLVAVLLVSPASNYNHALYLYFPLVTLLYTLDHEPGRRLLAAGVLVMSVPVQPAQIERVSELAGVSPHGQAVLMSGVEPILTLASITLYGLAFVVLGCLAVAVGPEGRRSTVDSVGRRAD